MQFLQHNMATIHTVIWFIWVEFDARSVRVGFVMYIQTHQDLFSTRISVVTCQVILSPIAFIRHAPLGQRESLNKHLTSV